MANYLFLAPGLPLPFSPLSPEAFEEIKCLAGKAWKQQTQDNLGCSTTYAGAYGNKGLDISTHHRVTPSSPTRVHKPHPPEVFLVNQLHYLPGHYGNAKGFRHGFLEASSDSKKFQIHSHKWSATCSPPDVLAYNSHQPSPAHSMIKHNAVVVASPVVPLDVIQRRIKHASLNGSQTGEETGARSSSTQDLLTGWPVTGSTHSVKELQTE